MLVTTSEANKVTTVVPVTSRFTLRRFSRTEDIPMTQARQLLDDHTKMMHGRMVGAGGPDFDTKDHINAFWAGLDAYLPPLGSYYLAFDSKGNAVGTGALKRVSDTMGEMKHLYVAPEARRAGLGRALVDARIRDAREMGLTELVADTFSANFEQPALYDKMGFQRSDPSEMGTSGKITPKLAPFMLYFRMTL